MDRFRLPGQSRVLTSCSALSQPIGKDAKTLSGRNIPCWTGSGETYAAMVQSNGFSIGPSVSCEPLDAHENAKVHDSEPIPYVIVIVLYDYSKKIPDFM